MYLGDGFIQTIWRAFSLWQKPLIKISISSAHSSLTPGQPVRALTGVLQGIQQNASFYTRTRPSHEPGPPLHVADAEVIEVVLEKLHRLVILFINGKVTFQFNVAHDLSGHGRQYFITSKQHSNSKLRKRKMIVTAIIINSSIVLLIGRFPCSTPHPAYYTAARYTTTFAVIAHFCRHPKTANNTGNCRQTQITK